MFVYALVDGVENEHVNPSQLALLPNLTENLILISQNLHTEQCLISQPSIGNKKIVVYLSEFSSKTVSFLGYFRIYPDLFVKKYLR